MRRPDQLIALNNNKIDILYKGLTIAKFNNTDFSSYWHDMIGTLRTCPWWHQVEPKITAENGTETNDNVNYLANTEEGNTVNSELVLWNNRAILIDLFLFADEDLAQKSNYIRARDKALNKAPTKLRTAPKKRSKESIEEQVDKALASDDLPEYLIGKRDSIISQIKSGKSVEEAIGLMRAIFG